MNHSGEKGGIDTALYVMGERNTEQFKHLQELLGTLLLALNRDGWTEEERIALLRCIDCLERKFIDAKRGKNSEQAG